MKNCRPSNPFKQTRSSIFSLSSSNFPRKHFLDSQTFLNMNKSAILAASVAAASATAVSMSSSAKLSLQDCGDQRGHGGSSPVASSASTEKFAPRFDGLRFIETLITAHR
ncbi:hypothetical protein VNO78_06093 [Psophocarpus tetragonolobus]|uniref:Uncharacterized protein n=1 Tax=Psophocarpus tetragonolobus TaxID=3891 RepID=A0AAN9ST66_PSOTE